MRNNYDEVDDPKATNDTTTNKSGIAGIVVVLVAICLVFGGWLIFSKSENAVKTKAQLEDMLKSGVNKTQEQTQKLKETVK